MLEDGEPQNDSLKNGNTKSSSAPKTTTSQSLSVWSVWVCEKHGGMHINRAVIQLMAWAVTKQLNPLVTADLWDCKMEFERPLYFVLYLI